MIDSKQIDLIETLLGYTFRDKRLLLAAFTSRPYAKENPHENEGRCNQRLEFLGDSVLGFLVAEQLFDATDFEEGKLTEVRQNLVKKEPLVTALERMDVLRFYRMGKGEQKDSNKKDKYKSDLFEAILGAVYVDSRKLEPVRELLARFMPQDVQPHKEPFVRLQEFLQANGIQAHQIGKSFVQESDGRWCCTLTVRDRPFSASGDNQDQAKRLAANLACEYLGC